MFNDISKYNAKHIKCYLGKDRKIITVTSAFYLMLLLMISYTTDYCFWETFDASCPHGSVILMTEAKYGRMQRGRCIQDRLETGCQQVISFIIKLFIIVIHSIFER